MSSLRHRRDGGLDVGRARARTSAYVYGNITVLAAVVATTPYSLDGWDGVVAVVATAVGTLLAHVLAESASHRIGARDGDAPWVRGELRDVLPIATSGTVPAVVLALGTLGVLSLTVAEVLATGIVLVRLAGVGLVVERLSGRKPSAGALWGGIGLAVVSGVVAVLKAVLTH